MPTLLKSWPTQSHDTHTHTSVFLSHQTLHQHSPRLSRLTEGSEGLAGLVLGTGLDSSLCKKIEAGNECQKTQTNKQKNIICETLLTEELLWITHFAVGWCSAPSVCIPLFLSISWLVKRDEGKKKKTVNSVKPRKDLLDMNWYIHCSHWSLSRCSISSSHIYPWWSIPQLWDQN